MIKNKKALSNIIATLIIISISLVAVSMVGITVKELIDNVSLSPELNCLNVKIQPPIIIKSACYDSKTNKIKIDLQRNIQNLQIKSLYFLSDSGSEWYCGENCHQCIIPNTGETKSYLLPSENSEEELTLKVNNCILEAKEVSVC